MADTVPTWTGIMRSQDGVSDTDALRFMIEQHLSQVETATLAKVLSVQAGGVGPVGMCTVQPMINQVDGAGQSYAQPSVHNVPYLRLQGGTNAVVIDPAVGDIGICLFCSRDNSAVKRAKTPSNPGSYRRFDLSDGLYLGGVLNGTPTNYVSFVGGNIRLHTPGTIFLDGNITHTGTFTSNSKNIGSTHTHSGVTTGAGTTGQPT
jgi:hypothetical protein